MNNERMLVDGLMERGRFIEEKNANQVVWSGYVTDINEVMEELNNRLNRDFFVRLNNCG